MLKNSASTAGSSPIFELVFTTFKVLPRCAFKSSRGSYWLVIALADQPTPRRHIPAVRYRFLLNGLHLKIATRCLRLLISPFVDYSAMSPRHHTISPQVPIAGLFQYSGVKRVRSQWRHRLKIQSHML